MNPVEAVREGAGMAGRVVCVAWQRSRDRSTCRSATTRPAALTRRSASDRRHRCLLRVAALTVGMALALASAAPASAHRADRTDTLSAHQQAVLHGIARDTW